MKLYKMSVTCRKLLLSEAWLSGIVSKLSHSYIVPDNSIEVNYMSIYQFAQ